MIDIHLVLTSRTKRQKFHSRNLLLFSYSMMQMDPKYRPSLVDSDTSRSSALPFAGSDLVLSPSQWSSHVVGLFFIPVLLLLLFSVCFYICYCVVELKHIFPSTA